LTAGIATVVFSKTMIKTRWRRCRPGAPADAGQGALAQIFSEAAHHGARFIGDDQATSMNATMAANYGISGQANLVSIGNLRVDKTSPFGATLLQGPPATPAPSGRPCSPGSAAAGTGPVQPGRRRRGRHRPARRASPFKSSQIGKDIRIANSNKLATWANGLPSSLVKTATPANLARVFSLTPAAEPSPTPPR